VLQYDRAQLIDLALHVFEYFNLPANFKIPKTNLRNFVTVVRSHGGGRVPCTCMQR
jgi:hypothetical protein